MQIKEIQEALQVLVRLPLQTAHRAADMRMLGFGQLKRNKDKEVPEYALHILCTWRLESPHGIVTGHRDLWEPINEDDWDEEWDYEKQGNLQDWKMGKLLKSDLYASKLFVESVRIKELGDLEILLSQGYKIVTFLNHSRGDSWVFFKPGDQNSFIKMDQDLSSRFSSIDT